MQRKITSCLGHFFQIAQDPTPPVLAQNTTENSSLRLRELSGEHNATLLRGRLGLPQ